MEGEARERGELTPLAEVGSRVDAQAFMLEFGG